MTHLFSKPSAFFCSCIILISFSCKKNNTEKIAHNYKIEVIAGNNQSDTVGQILPDSIKIRVLTDKVPLPKWKIMVVQQGCTFTKKDILPTDSNGIASYSWELTPTIGDQVIKLLEVGI